MLAWDTHLPNGCVGHSAIRFTRRIVEQYPRSGRTPIHFRPPPNTRCFTCRLPTTWQSSWRRSVSRWRTMMVPFHRLSLISESPFGDRWPSSSSNDRVGSRMPMQVANSPKHDGFVQTAQQLPSSWVSTLFGYPRTGRIFYRSSLCQQVLDPACIHHRLVQRAPLLPVAVAPPIYR